MKKKFLLLLCFIAPLLGSTYERNFLTDQYYNDYSDIEAVFLYGTINSLGGYPMAGAGIRMKKGFNGLDFSASIMPPNGSNLIYKAKCDYLFFPVQEGFYLGAGGGVLTEPESIEGTSGFAEGVFGYQWRIRDKAHVFLEGNVVSPFKVNEEITTALWPSLCLGFGY